LFCKLEVKPCSAQRMKSAERNAAESKLAMGRFGVWRVHTSAAVPPGLSPCRGRSVPPSAAGRELEHLCM
jgi:hypothetical protein